METVNKTPLVKKLGIKNGFIVKLINEPQNFIQLLEGLPNDVRLVSKLKEPVDLIHLFTRSKKELSVEFPFLKNYIKKDGMLWISWIKRGSNSASDLNSNVVREIGLLNGLVDIKVCSIDNNWSAQKFVFRLKDR